MSTTRSLAVLLLQLAQAALAAVTVILLAHLLDPQGYGVYVYYVTIASALPLIVGVGGEHVFLMQGSRKPDQVGPLFGTAAAVRLIGSLFALAVAAAALTVVPAATPSALLLITAGALLTAFSNPLIVSLHRVQGTYLRPFVIALSAPVAYIVFLLVVGRGGMTLHQAALGFFLSHVLTLLLFVADLRGRVHPRPHWDLARRYASDGTVFSLSQVFDYAFARLDILLVQFILGPAALGVYAAGQRLVSLSIIIPSSFHIVELPEFHRAAGTPALADRFRSLRRLLVDVAFLAFGLLILNAEFLVGLLFPAEYAGAAPVVVLLSVAMGVYFLNYPYYMLAEALNLLRPRLVAKATSFVLTIGLVAGFTLWWGIVGAATGLMAGNAVFVAQLHYLTRSDNGGLVALVYDLRTGLAAVVAYAAGAGAAQLLPPGWPAAVVASATFVVVLGLTGSVLGLSESARKLMDLARRRAR